jgi:hypothetical protein
MNTDKIGATFLLIVSRFGLGFSYGWLRSGGIVLGSDLAAAGFDLGE